MRVWAEPETGGESYIPHAASKRGKSLDIWRQTGRILGAPEAQFFAAAVSTPRRTCRPRTRRRPTVRRCRRPVMRRWTPSIRRPSRSSRSRVRWGRALSWARTQVGKPYIWGGVGSDRLRLLRLPECDHERAARSEPVLAARVDGELPVARVRGGRWRLHDRVDAERGRRHRSHGRHDARRQRGVPRRPGCGRRRLGSWRARRPVRHPRAPGDVPRRHGPTCRATATICCRRVSGSFPGDEPHPGRCGCCSWACSRSSVQRGGPDHGVYLDAQEWRGMTACVRSTRRR
jgi:hypothetical protein